MSSKAESHLSNRCKIMRRLIKTHGPCDLVAEKRSPYEALVNAVAHQQLNGKAAQSILRRFKALFPGTRFPKPAHIMTASDKKLRSAGFSFGKIRAIRDIAEKTQSGLVPTRAKAIKLSDDELIARLIEVHGVGRWTVEMLLIFTLGRKDVFPCDDFGVRNGFRVAMKLDDMPKPSVLREHSKRWAPHRTLAAWYLWRAADAEKSDVKAKGKGQEAKGKS